jgi:hypothetical protein
VFDNWVGRSPAGAQLSNRIGIEMRGPGSALQNHVWFNFEQGIFVVPPAAVSLRHNSTFANGGLGIAGPNSPQRPTLDVVHATFGNETRTWFVVETPGVAEGVVEVFANPDCADPNEGVTLLRMHGIVGPGHQVLVPVDAVPPGGFTATVTVYDGPGETGQGRTSIYSNCAVAHAYADTSGTGIPDVVQLALGGDPSDPTRAVFPGDGDARVSLLASAGQLHNVRPVTAPAGAGDLQFPAGLYSFEVTGLEPGGQTAVLVDLGVGAAQYWRFGLKPDHISVGWYPWTFDANTNLGARPENLDAGVTTRWTLFFEDGKAGDDDGVANGTVVDPGGAANGVGPTTVADQVTVLPPVVLQPAFTG